MDILLSLSTVFPILIYMLLGAFLNHIKQLSVTTQAEMNKVIFTWFFPMVMFNNIYRTSLDEVLNAPFLITMVVLVLAVAVASIVLIPRVFPDKRQQGSMIQGIIRGNSLLFALPVVAAISGQDNTGLASLTVVVLVPIFNTICVVVLEALRGTQMRLWPLLKSVVKNPLILGALLGLAFKVLNIQLPAMVDQVVRSLAGLVTPLALIMLGAGLKFSDTMGYRKQLTVVAVVKLLAVPLLFVLTVRLLGFGQVETTTALAISAVPTAVSTFVMAKQMGADGVLAGQIVATTTSLSIVTVFLWVLALSGLGWIG